MAKAGFKGHYDPLSGERGFLKMMTGTEDIDFVEPLLDGTFAVEKAYTKPYAACRYCHPSIEAAILMKVGPQRASGVRVVCIRPCCCFEPRIATCEL